MTKQVDDPFLERKIPSPELLMAVQERKKAARTLPAKLYQFAYLMQDNKKDWIPWERRHEIKSMSVEDRKKLGDEYETYTRYLNSRFRDHNISTVYESIAQLAELGILHARKKEDEATVADIMNRASALQDRMQRDKTIFSMVKLSPTDAFVVEKERHYNEFLSAEFPNDADFMRAVKTENLGLFFPELSRMTSDEQDEFFEKERKRITSETDEGPKKEYIDCSQYIPQTLALAKDALHFLFPKTSGEEEFKKMLQIKLGQEIAAERAELV